MENIPNNIYKPSTEIFKDEAFEDAVKNHPEESLVYLEVTKQVGKVEEVKATADGPAVKVSGMGLVPVSELRIASEEDINNSRYKNDVEMIDDHYYFKK